VLPRGARGTGEEAAYGKEAGRDGSVLATDAHTDTDRGRGRRSGQRAPPPALGLCRRDSEQAAYREAEGLGRGGG